MPTLAACRSSADRLTWPLISGTYYQVTDTGPFLQEIASILDDDGTFVQETSLSQLLAYPLWSLSRGPWSIGTLPLVAGRSAASMFSLVRPTSITASRSRARALVGTIVPAQLLGGSTWPISTSTSGTTSGTPTGSSNQWNGARNAMKSAAPPIAPWKCSVASIASPVRFSNVLTAPSASLRPDWAVQGYTLGRHRGGGHGVLHRPDPVHPTLPQDGTRDGEPGGLCPGESRPRGTSSTRRPIRYRGRRSDWLPVVCWNRTTAVMGSRSVPCCRPALGRLSASYDADADRKPIWSFWDGAAPTVSMPSMSRRYLRQGLPPLQGLAMPASDCGISQFPSAALQVPDQRNTASPGQALDAPVRVRIEQEPGPAQPAPGGSDAPAGSP